MRKRRIGGSRSAVWRFFDRHGISFKKKTYEQRSKSAPTWPAHAGAGCGSRTCLIRPRLVFIDETSTSTNMVRFGAVPRGKRLISRVPQGHWKTITFVAGLRHNKMVAPFIVDGAMNRASFLTYLERCLRPTLKRGDIVIFDNLPAHKGTAVKQGYQSGAHPACSTCRNIPPTSIRSSRPSVS